MVFERGVREILLTHTARQSLENQRSNANDENLTRASRARTQVRHGKIEEARELVRNSTSVQLRLVDAQLSLMEKDYDSAVQTLSSSESISFLPGVVGTIVSILSSRGEKSDEEKQKCDETIDRALKYWNKG